MCLVLYHKIQFIGLSIGYINSSETLMFLYKNWICLLMETKQEAIQRWSSRARCFMLSINLFRLIFKLNMLFPLLHKTIDWVLQNGPFHRIIELFRLEKTFKSIKSNYLPDLPTPITEASPLVPLKCLWKSLH